MPRRDGTGPTGAGAMTGRGLGGCVGVPANGQNPNFGIGCRRCAGRGGMRGLGVNRGLAGSNPEATRKETLERQRAALRASLDQVDAQLSACE